jgi:phenylalanyl-tRNA synthetase beta chain
MIVPESWLRTFCSPRLSGREIADRLTMSGLEVETYEPVGPAFSGVVIGEIVAVDKHPNADKLTVCKVKAGKETLQVVCGAPNVRVGMKAPLAMVGARLPKMEIKPAELRGVKSVGMLCSARELGLSDDHSGLLELDGKIGTDARVALGLDDHVMTLKLTPNRADCLSVLGVAREVAAITKTALKPVAIKPTAAKSKARHLVKLADPEGCGRFAGRVIRGVNASAATPQWMKQRLELAGQRSISALVDVTNYVMLELGRPLHVYDLDKLRGPIVVRWGRKGEKVLLLNEQEAEVDESVLCITDDSGVIGLGGIMGGESTKADENTANVFLESAFFWPDAIQGRARRYGFTSDAAHRFERGVDFQNNVDGIERATKLILEICGGEPGPTVDTVARLPKRKPVTMRVARAQKVIGVPVPVAEMAAAFNRLGLPFKKKGETFTVTPPSHRFDIAIEEDLIEEVVRIQGYDRVGATIPRSPHPGGLPEGYAFARRVRDALARAGLREVKPLPFVSETDLSLLGDRDAIPLTNPLRAEEGWLRARLLPGLLHTIERNQRWGTGSVAIFEVGTVFRLADPVEERGHVAFALSGSAEQGWTAGDRVYDVLDARGALEALLGELGVEGWRLGDPPGGPFHPGRSAEVLLGDRSIGVLGELHPRAASSLDIEGRVAVAELDVEPLADAASRGVRFVEVPRFPPVRRDLAFVVEEDVPAVAVQELLELAGGELLDRAVLFDLFRGGAVADGKKSLAFALEFRAPDRTLTDEEVEPVVAAIVERVRSDLGGELRA